VQTLLLSMLAGCGKMAIDGTVSDVSGEPIVGARVTLIGTQCQTVTDAEGRFELPCLPGVYTLTIGADSYLAQDIEQFDASERKRYDVGTRNLIKLPTDKGLLKFVDNAYEPLARGWIERRKGGSGTDQWKIYCLPEDEAERAEIPVNTFAAGNQPFFDNDSGGWRAWKLDEEGCAYRMAPDTKSSWEMTYGEKPEMQEQRLEDGKSIVVLALEPGAYFVADWGTGFFKSATENERKAYWGHHLVVQ